MQQAHRLKLDLFLENFQGLKHYLPFRLGFSKTMAAYLFAQRKQALNKEGIDRVKNKLSALPFKQSEFRHAAELFLWTELALSEDEDKLIERAGEAFALIHKNHLGDPWVKSVLALQMAQHLQPQNFEAHVKRLVFFKKTMRLNHRILAGRYYTVLVSALLLSGVDQIQLLGRIESAYALMKIHCPQRMRSYTAAVVLAFATDIEQQVQRYAELGEACKSRHLSVFNRYSVNSLALLSLLPVDFTALAEEMSEMHVYLRGQKDFSALYTPLHSVAILTTSVIVTSFSESQQVKTAELTAAEFWIADHAVLAVAEDLMRRAESSQAG